MARILAQVGAADARAAEINASGDVASSPGAVSTGSSGGALPTPSGQPWRSASTAWAARREGEALLRA